MALGPGTPGTPSTALLAAQGRAGGGCSRKQVPLPRNSCRPCTGAQSSSCVACAPEALGRGQGRPAGPAVGGDPRLQEVGVAARAGARRDGSQHCCQGQPRPGGARCAGARQAPSLPRAPPAKRTGSGWGGAPAPTRPPGWRCRGPGRPSREAGHEVSGLLDARRRQPLSPARGARAAEAGAVLEAGSAALVGWRARCSSSSAEEGEAVALRLRLLTGRLPTRLKPTLHVCRPYNMKR